MPELELAVIVVSHNSEKWLGNFFATWGRALAESPVVHEILVADAGSTVLPPMPAEGGADVVRVISCGNVGYGAAINRAAKETQARWLLLCNPDISFGEDFVAGFLKPMMEKPPAGAGCIAPRLVNEDGSVQWSVGRFPTVGRLITDQFREPPRRKFIYPAPTGFYNWATGACLLIRREHFEQVGGFDEKFFLYVEEVDLQRRLADLGLRTWFVQEIGLMHHAPNAARAPRPEVRKWSSRGLLRHFAKHGRFGQLAGYRALALFSGRLSVAEALAPRARILACPTGP